jgi:hypothetical protein
VKFMLMTPSEREEVLKQLEGMPGFLAERFRSLTAREGSEPGRGDTFSPVEQCWHLADLEREGFGVRIRRLLAEDDPRLPDFDGARVAQERGYKGRSLEEGLVSFREARAANLSLLRSLSSRDSTGWSRQGTQEGVGRVALGDIPDRMAQHDAAHRAEILDWCRQQ